MANTFEKIATVNVGSGGATSIDFTSIPQTYTDLMIKGSIRTDRGTYGVDETLLQFNGDTTAGNYNHRFLRGNGSAADSSTTTGGYPWGPGGNGSVNTANTFGNGENYIPIKIISSKETHENKGKIVVKFDKQNVQFIKVIAENNGIITDGKPGAGSNSWLFVDEISVE